MSSRQIGNGIIGRLWKWLQNSPAPVRSLLLLVIYIVVGVALEKLAVLFGSSWQVQPWDPAAGWHIVLLFGFGLRYIFAVPIAPFIEYFLFKSQGEGIVSVTLSGVYVASFYGAASALLLYKWDLDPRLSRLRDVVKFSVTFVVASLCVAIFNISSLLALGKLEPSEWISKVMHGWAGEATGIAMLAPPLLILLRRFPWSQKHLTLQGSPPDISLRLPRFNEIKDWLGLFALTTLFTWAAHGGIKSKGLDYAYFTFVPLTLVCAWKGFESTTVITLLINIMAVSFVGKKVGSNDPLVVQFGLMTVTYVGLLLSAFVSARNRESDLRKGLEQQLRYDATHDSLTGLHNRAWFLDRLEQTKNKASENENYLYAVLFLDLDRFKTVNDSLGHLVGDELLVLIAQKLRECLPETTSVARLGGDEFTIILEELMNISQASQTAEEICQHLRQTYIVDNYKVFITASMGIAFNYRNSQNSNLLRDADIALYEAKARGKSQYVVFDRQMYERVITRTQLEQDLRQAIDELDNPPQMSI